MRARGIKPDICLDENLVKCSSMARLLAVYLPMYADRDGRFEFRPLRIKAAIFPYDDGLDIEALLKELVTINYINVYVINEQKFAEINNFSSNQRPHNNEVPSTIPPPTQVEQPTFNQGEKSFQPREKALRSDTNTDLNTDLNTDSNNSNTTADDETKKKAREIFNWCESFFGSCNPLVLAPIYSWLSWGADFEMDIQPICERWLKKNPKKPIKSLSWLDDDIARSIVQRNKPQPEIYHSNNPYSSPAPKIDFATIIKQVMEENPK